MIGQKIHGLQYKVGDVRPGDRPSWSKVVVRDCRTQHLCEGDAVDCNKWRKVVIDVAC